MASPNFQTTTAAAAVAAWSWSAALLLGVLADAGAAGKETESVSGAKAFPTAYVSVTPPSVAIVSVALSALSAEVKAGTGTLRCTMARVGRSSKCPTWQSEVPGVQVQSFCPAVVHGPYGGSVEERGSQEPSLRFLHGVAAAQVQSCLDCSMRMSCGVSTVKRVSPETTTAFGSATESYGSASYCITCAPAEASAPAARISKVRMSYS